MIAKRKNCYHPQKLRGLLVSHGFEPPSKFSSVLGVGVKSMRNKLCGDSMFTRAQLLFIKSYFRLSAEEFCDIFYDTSEVQDAVSLKMFEHDRELDI